MDVGMGHDGSMTVRRGSVALYNWCAPATHGRVAFGGRARRLWGVDHVEGVAFCYLLIGV